jgi:hypothetical protein
VLKYLRETIQWGKSLFWSMVSEVLVHGHLASSLWIYGKAEHHGREYMVEQSCSPHGSQKAKKKPEERARDKTCPSRIQ